MNVLFTSVGRRVSLVHAFRCVLESRHEEFRLIGGDCSPLAPALQFCDERVILPPISDSAYVPAVLKEARRLNIHLIVPLIDPDVVALARHHDTFADNGIVLHAPSTQTAELTFDKLELHRYLSAAGISSPTCAPLVDLAPEFPGPAVVKPRQGCGSVGISFHQSLNEARHARSDEIGLIVQPYVRGDEFSIDMYVDRSGGFRSAVIRQQLKARAGEVAVGVTVRNDSLLHLAEHLVQALPASFGVMHCDLIIDADTGEPYILDVNCRFPGGYVLSHTAGAPYISWLLAEANSEALPERNVTVEEGLTMLRFDSELYLRADSTRRDS